MKVKNSDSAVLRNLPSVDEVLQTAKVRSLRPLAGEALLTELARASVDETRGSIAAGRVSSDLATRDALLEAIAENIESRWNKRQRAGIQRVINATGVIIHTNLGRAPLSENAVSALRETASGYCTVEYDLDPGARGDRGEHCESLIRQLTGAEDAIVVNNCAAAAFLVMTIFASGGEVVISRGELVEIGGDFRVPDVLAQSGAVLREVGTTNRTKLGDYAKAISPETKMILRVHPSNFKIVGFTATPSVSALATLAHEHKVLLFEDIGSGALLDLARYGLKDEPVVSRSIEDGADLVTFSGDKLLGGPQAGIIAGRGELIERIRRHPLYRALRVGKLVYASLEATLEAYVRGSHLEELPVLRMIAANDLTERTSSFLSRFDESGKSRRLKAASRSGSSVVGGGSAPAVHPDTTLLALEHDTLSADALGSALRSASPPVIARIADEKVMIDLRTVSEKDEDELLKVLTSIG
jgi:L-seryl-tRNA(Ser) seleniumtransferase